MNGPSLWDVYSAEDVSIILVIWSMKTNKRKRALSDYIQCMLKLKTGNGISVWKHPSWQYWTGSRVQRLIGWSDKQLAQSTENVFSWVSRFHSFSIKSLVDGKFLRKLPLHQCTRSVFLERQVFFFSFSEVWAEEVSGTCQEVLYMLVVYQHAQPKMSITALDEY